jgi:hypothetical protein
MAIKDNNEENPFEDIRATEEQTNTIKAQSIQRDILNLDAL